MNYSEDARLAELDSALKSNAARRSQLVAEKNAINAELARNH